MIAVQSQSRTYLTALLPKDQIFDDEDEIVMPSPPKKPKINKDLMSIGNNDDDGDDDENNTKNEPEAIDNPYLRPAKICPRRDG